MLMEPTLIHESLEEFSNSTVENNYLKKAVWSSIGDYIVLASEDNRIRIFTLPFESFNSIWHSPDCKQFNRCSLPTPIAVKEQNHIYDITTFNEGGIEGKEFVVSSCKSAPVSVGKK